VPKVEEDGPFWDVRLAAVGAGCRVIHVGTQAEVSFKMRLLERDLKSLGVFSCGSDCFCYAGIVVVGGWRSR